jgi:hypothetical protein
VLHKAYHGMNLLGAHREGGHFIRRIAPLVGLFGNMSRAKEHVMFVFLEELSSDIRYAHERVAKFLNMDPSRELPENFKVQNKNEWSQSPRQQDYYPSSVGGDGGGDDDDNNDNDDDDDNDDGGSGSEDSKHKELKVMAFLETYYAESTRKLNDFLRDDFGIENKWWNSPIQ